MSPGCLPIIRVNQSVHYLDVAPSTGSVPSGVGGLLLDYLALELGIIIDPCCSANTIRSWLPAGPEPLGAEGNQILSLHLALPAYPWSISTGEFDDASFNPVATSCDSSP
jgi:hypothetical protein